MPLTIQNIDEQFINVGTPNYDLSIAIGGSPDSVEPTGLLESFYHDWDATTGVLHIKSDEVRRLTSKGIWTITASKSGEPDVSREIIYNVVPIAPIITSPGNQTIYKGAPVDLHVPIANNPAIMRASGLLAGLNWESFADEEGNQTIQTTGAVPVNAVSTESAFDATYYAENDGGSDSAVVRFTINDPFIVVWERTTRTLDFIDASDGSRVNRYVAPTGTYTDCIQMPDGVVLNGGGNVRKIDASGNVAWTYDDTGWRNASIQYKGDLYLSAGEGRRISPYLVIKIDGATGEEVWRWSEYDFNTSRLEPIVGVGDYIYIFDTGSGTRLYKIGVQTGIQDAMVTLDGTWFYEDSWTSTRDIPIHQGGYIYAYNVGGLLDYAYQVLKIDVDDLSIEFGVTASPNNFDTDIDSWAIDRDGNIYITDTNRLYRFNAFNGNQDWVIQPGSGRNYQDVAVLENVLYAADAGDQQVFKINKATGAILGTVNGPSGSDSASGLERAVYQEDAIYVPFDDALIRINDTSFTLAWTVNNTFSNWSNTRHYPLLDNTKIYTPRVVSGNPVLAAINLNDGSQAWSYQLSGGNISSPFFFGSV